MGIDRMSGEEERRKPSGREIMEVGELRTKRVARDEKAGGRVWQLAV